MIFFVERKIEDCFSCHHQLEGARAVKSKNSLEIIISWTAWSNISDDSDEHWANNSKM